MKTHIILAIILSIFLAGESSAQDLMRADKLLRYNESSVFSPGYINTTSQYTSRIIDQLESRNAQTGMSIWEKAISYLQNKLTKRIQNRPADSAPALTGVKSPGEEIKTSVQVQNKEPIPQKPAKTDQAAEEWPVRLITPEDIMQPFGPERETPTKLIKTRGHDNMSTHVNMPPDRFGHRGTQHTIRADSVAAITPEGVKRDPVIGQRARTLKYPFSISPAGRKCALKKYTQSTAPYYKKAAKIIANNLALLQSLKILSKELIPEDVYKMSRQEIERAIKTVKNSQNKAFGIEYIKQEEAKYRKAHIDPNKALLKAKIEPAAK